MIITTTNGIEGKRVVEYKGIVCGEVISGVDFIKDLQRALRIFSAAVQNHMKAN